MSLKYLVDPDLQLLSFADHRTLELLAKHLTRDSAGGERPSQSLLAEARFKAANSDLSKVWDLIAAELQHYGANSVVSYFRGHGVEYREILVDACEKLSFKFDSKQSTVQIEDGLYDFLEQLLWIASPANRTAKVEQLFEVPIHFSEEVLEQVKNDFSLAFRLGSWLSAQIPFLHILLMRTVLSARGSNVLSPDVITYILAQTVIHSVTEISGPAYDVTIPAVFYVIFLRRILNTDIY